MMRIKSNHARGTFQQLRLAVRLTYRLYALYYRIEAIKSKLEVCFTPLSLPVVQSTIEWRLSWQWTNSKSPSPSRRVLLAQCFLSHSRYASTMLCTSRTFTSHHDGLSYCFSHNPLPAATSRMFVATPSRLFVCVCMWCSRPICFPRQRDFGYFTPVRDRYSIVMGKSHCATFQRSAGVCAWRVELYIAHKAFNICQCGRDIKIN